MGEAFFPLKMKYWLIFHNRCTTSRRPGLLRDGAQAKTHRRAVPLPPHHWKETSTYPIVEAKIGRDLGLEDVDEGQDLVLVAPEQLVRRVGHEERLLVGLEQGLDQLPQEAELRPLHGSLRGTGRFSGHSPRPSPLPLPRPSPIPPLRAPTAPPSGKEGWKRNRRC